MRLRNVVVVVVLVAAMSVSALAFDGQRKGFILGGGVGFGMTSFTQTVEGYGQSVTSDRENKGAFMTNFKIGWGASEQLEIYYTQKSSFFGITNALDENVTILNAVGGVGVSYSLNLSAPTPFFTGGIGLATWSLPFEDNAPDTWTGFGFYVGAGYEFARHYSGELDLVYGNPGDSQGGLDASSSALSVRLTINALAY